MSLCELPVWRLVASSIHQVSPTAERGSPASTISGAPEAYCSSTDKAGPDGLIRYDRDWGGAGTRVPGPVLHIQEYRREIDAEELPQGKQLPECRRLLNDIWNRGRRLRSEWILREISNIKEYAYDQKRKLQEQKACYEEIVKTFQGKSAMSMQMLQNALRKNMLEREDLERRLHQSKTKNQTYTVYSSLLKDMGVGTEEVERSAEALDCLLARLGGLNDEATRANDISGSGAQISVRMLAEIGRQDDDACQKVGPAHASLLKDVGPTTEWVERSAEVLDHLLAQLDDLNSAETTSNSKPGPGAETLVRILARIGQQVEDVWQQAGPLVEAAGPCGGGCNVLGTPQDSSPSSTLPWSSKPGANNSSPEEHGHRGREPKKMSTASGSGDEDEVIDHCKTLRRRARNKRADGLMAHGQGKRDRRPPTPRLSGDDADDMTEPTISSPEDSKASASPSEDDDDDSEASLGRRCLRRRKSREESEEIPAAKRTRRSDGRPTHRRQIRSTYIW